MKEDKYIRNVSGKRLFRVMAWVGLIIIAVLIIATLITGITGSKYFMGCLVLCIVVPIFMYVILWIGRVLSSVNEESLEHVESEKNDMDSDSEKDINKVSNKK